MKPSILKTLSPLIVLCIFFLASCKKDKCEQTVTYKIYEPVYMSYDELRKSVKSETAQPLKTPGKIYIKGHYLFINEINKGIHIFDNSNPSSPQNISFIKIPGNADLAAVGNVLYADSYIDLLALDISNPLNVTVIKRVQDALPYGAYVNGNYADQTKGVPVEWIEKEVTEKVGGNCNDGNYYGRPYMLEDGTFFNGVDLKGSASAPTSSPTNPGTGGSTARFTIANNALYIVDESKLHVYDISSTSNPVKVTDKNLGWSIQTIFPYKNHLFIGSNSAVYIYDNSNPLNPIYISTYDHITACDPVVVDDDYAYFTLSNDAPCHMGVNQLEVVDIKDKAHPTLKTTVPMTNPKGIGIDDKKLFICDGNDGLKVYDATDVMDIQNKQISHFGNINSFDVIPYNNLLLMIGSDGFYQYDYSNIHHITLLSRIPVEK